MNLNQALGADYIRQMCVGAVFELDNEVHILRDVVDDHYQTKALDLATNKPKWKSAKVPLDKLTNWSSFSYPKLGYRMVQSPDNGPVVFQLHNRRSAMRGLRIEHLNVEYLPVYSVLLTSFFEAWHMIGSEQKVQALYRPKFLSFAEGVSSILNGDALAFAVNEDIAVVVAYSANDNKVADILFKNRVVGSVANDGTIALANKIMQRDNLRRKFER